MCGIVGLHLRNPDLYPRLGELLTGMLCEMGERGPDSAGVAVYGDSDLSPEGHASVSLLEVAVEPGQGERSDGELPALADLIGSALGMPATARQIGDTVVVAAPVPTDVLVTACRAAAPSALIAGFGRDVTVLKGVGHPRELTRRYGLAHATGWQGVGHTRMATESAVDPAGCHPYAVGPDQCLVHNGSFANHATIRRLLRAEGVEFDSDNDTEVGARFVAHQLAAGADIDLALKRLCAEFDGFYTLLVSNSDSFAVVRDAIACKPAVIAETDDWVAVASEYRAMVGLPGIADANLFEPEPEVVYSWSRLM